MEKSNTSKRWPIEEEFELLKEIDNGCSIAEISEIHQRSKNAIVMRICDIAKRKIDKNEKTIQEAQEKLKLVSISEIENYIKRENDKKKKLEEDTKNNTEDTKNNTEDTKNNTEDKKKKNNKDSKLENKKEDPNKLIIIKLNELNKKVDDLQELSKKYNILEEKYNILEEKYNELNTNKQEKKIKINKQEKKIKIKKKE